MFRFTGHWPWLNKLLDIDYKQNPFNCSSVIEAHIKILWHIGPIAGNESETRQQSLLGSVPRATMYCWKRRFLWGPLWGYMTRPTEISSVSECGTVEYSGVKWVGSRAVSQRTAAVRSLWAVAVRSWGTGIVREPIVRGTAAVEAVTRQRLVKAQQTEKTWCVL
jgi:hypothetical protein